MQRPNKLHSALIAGWACLCLSAGSSAIAELAPADPAQLLKHADEIKSANHDEFAKTLKQLDAESARLTQPQQMYLRYLKAWQTAYFGDYEAAGHQLDAIADDSRDITLRLRAGMTAVNVQAIAKRYQEAYTRLHQMLDLLPQVSDPAARSQGLLVAADLYNAAGQYDLALNYANTELAESIPGSPRFCRGMQARLFALNKSGKLQNRDGFRGAIDACMKVGEPLFAGLIRSYAANFDIAHNDPDEAIKLLESNYDEVEQTRYPELIADVDSALAQAHWKAGNAQAAQSYALRVVDDGIKNEYTDALVGAYGVLYQIAEKQGDYQSALAYHEKFAAADKGYLNDASARTLAYQMVRQKVDALSKQNQVLQLRQEISRKAAEARDLYLVMLLVVLGSIALWAWRTKRSEIRFMHISRHDGLTAVFNRQHFVNAAEAALGQCMKGSQDASVILIDLDHFKVVNDTHGHAVGDKVLKCTVAACQSHLGAKDLLGRLGGEEFGILLPDCVATTAKQVAERIRVAIVDCSGTEEGVDFPISASFGIAGTRMSGYTLRHLLIHADNALYQAKREGRNRVVVYDHTKADATPLPPGVLDRRRG